ncbi:hypothetical protein [Paenibacillus flagellatus]|uniref:NodB homology domain-containing protein n=1 Tax=Paenibacillus flagellatus TaxID=2211139 RepID=A0A2V5KAB4_9BACL|nr:hypothetical protein [Paenibacillus flagellatus]PYI55842.1 hypothetical protein DLM86_08995 [Paenibacillus flagellatus]
MTKMAKIAVLYDRNAVLLRQRFGLNAFGLYAGEVLAHAGLPFATLNDAEELEHCDCDVVVAAVCSEDDRTVAAITAYMERGGIVIGCANLNKLGVTLGYAKEACVAPGYALLEPAGNEERTPLRFLEALPWRSGAAGGGVTCEEKGRIVRDRPDGEPAGAALQTFRVGGGRLYRWSVDIWDTIVRLQQGKGPVLEDGAPAPDGTGAVDDGILKADDQAAVDWRWDRKTTETGMPYFAYPYADLWREAFVGALLGTVVETGKTVPFVGYYPDGVSQVLMISHDSDHNQDKQARTTLALLAELGIRTTWCMLEPGYGKPVYDEVKAAGHELAFHYNALEAQGGAWAEEEFARQLQWLKDAADLDGVTSNKNHYTRFEGWGELFEWCERHGIAADQTRGPSKKGNVGMLFGTCHPYFPIAWSTEGNRMYDVLEMSFLTQDLELSNLSDNSVIVPFLEQVKRVGGVAHFLYHQIHIDRWEAVRDSIRLLVREARRLGFDFWTGKKVNDWERYRRSLIPRLDDEGNVVVDGRSEGRDIVVYVPVSSDGAGDSGSGTEIRFGIRCRRTVVRI